MTETYPRQKAATRNFQLGAPRSFQINGPGKFITFLRSDHSQDSVNALWIFDLTKNLEEKLVDPRKLFSGEEDVPAAEKARRERMRETTSGITAYSISNSGELIVFALSGSLFKVSTKTKSIEELDVTGPIIDPQVSPDGQSVAWTNGKDLFIYSLANSTEKNLTRETGSEIVWGLVDFIAAEELGRVRGFWWSPDSTQLLVERFDTTHVPTWWISDPTNPMREPQQHKYPASGTTNPEVEIYLFDLTGNKTKVVWDNSTFEYLVSVNWETDHNALITVANRAQTNFEIFELIENNLEIRHKLEDPKFIDVIPGQPKWLDSELVTVLDDSQLDSRSIFLGNQVITEPGLQILGISGVVDNDIYFVGTKNALDRDIFRISTNGALTQLTFGGVNSISNPVKIDHDTYLVLASSQLVGLKREFSLQKNGIPIHVFDNLAAQPIVKPTVHYLKTGDHQVNTAVLFPTEHKFGSKKLPVMMRPYGGPHSAQVLNGALVYTDDQWFADQGFVVIVADNRGTPGRGPNWDRSIYQNFLVPVLEDQVAAVTEVARQYPDDIDLNRVGITGWSFGGYLSALAVLERPDVFHAAVAGAPVTDWALYDTAYTERYLGHPDKNAQVYKEHSLIEKAHKLSRPLLLVHGLADDNVVAAHSLRLSAELLAHKKHHEFLPLAGVTHMTPQETITENLMLRTVEFFKKNL